MRPLRPSLVLLGCLALGSGATAQEPEPASPEAAEAEQPPRPPPPAEADRRAGGSDDVFIPSEELQADQEATFPVDI